MFFYFQNKLYEQKKQILFLTNQNNLIRSKRIKDIVIKYYVPEYKYAFTKEICSINLAPIDNPLPLCKLQKNTSIGIINRADINGSIWYQVSVPSNERINNQGWLKASQLVFPEIINNIEAKH